jgi:large subunit ribosomal protein L15
MTIALNTIRNKKAASHSKMRVGRGIGSGKGKTAGRGHKGQKSRSGVSISWFEGGQSPLYRRLPRRGFNNAVFKKDYAVVNLCDLDRMAGAKKIGESVDYETLRSLGEIATARDGLKVLGRGVLKARLDITAAMFSASAKAAIEKAGGTANQIAVKRQDGVKAGLSKPARPSRIEKKRAKKSA